MAHKSENKTMLERFEEKFIPVTESGCWIWTASCHERGYGLFHTGRNLKKGKMEFAHRVSYELYKGVRPSDEECVCHSCDNPYCVNPSHLFIGTHKDNMDDMKRKGRLVSARQRVTKVQQEEAIRLRSEGFTNVEIANILNISDSHASRISRGLRKYFNKEEDNG